MNSQDPSRNPKSEIRNPKSNKCYHPGMSFVLLYIVIGIVVFYLVAGVLRWLRQEFQPDTDRKKDSR